MIRKRNIGYIISLRGTYTLDGGSEAVFGLKMVIWDFAFFIFKDLKIRFLTKMLKKVISDAWGLVKISPKITKKAK